MMDDVPERFDERTYLQASGAEFKRARLARNLTREGLSELSGVHLNTIGAAERGEHDINSSTKCSLLAALGCKSIIMDENVDSIVLHESLAAFPRTDIQAMPDACVVSIIGQVLRERRNSLGATLEQVACNAGLHANTLWNIELGLVSPHGVHLHRIYRALGVRIVTPGPAGILLE